APVTDNENHNEVSGYGVPDYAGDSNDHFRVEILHPTPPPTARKIIKRRTLEDGSVEEDEEYEDERMYLKAIQSKFRLVHVNTHCVLFSHSVKLPEWAFGQQEVTCAKNGRKSLSTWRIELNENDMLPADAPRINYKKPSFFSKFIEIHKVMWDINKGLTSSHPFDSRPSSWPTLRRGISFWTAKNGGPGQIYLIGNPIVWWGATFSIVAYVGAYFVNMVLEKRKINVARSGELRGEVLLGEVVVLQDTVGGCAGLLFFAWALHYFPFFLMARQLFLHHYFPALYFSVLLLALIFELLTIRIKSNAARWAIFAFALFVVVWVYIDFAPLTYGHAMTKESNRTPQSETPAPIGQAVTQQDNIEVET
ncbi:hypothetical protein HK102_002649, partial [Quaeritorhiza haematococci]